MKDRVILHVDVNNAFLSWSAVWLLKNGYKVDIRNRFAVIGVMRKSEKVLFWLRVFQPNKWVSLPVKAYI